MLTVLLPLLLAQTPQPSVTIPAEFRARNTAQDCVWCCLQTVARHQGVTPLSDVLKNAPPGGAYFEDIHQRLRKLNIAHYYQSRGPQYTAEMSKALGKEVGVIVSLNNPRRPGTSHAVIVASLGPAQVRYYDPDHPAHLWAMPRAEFDQRWDGQALFLDYLPPPRRLLVADLKR